MNIVPPSSFAKSLVVPQTPRISSELYALTYGSLVTQIIRDFPDVIKANQQMEKMGWDMGSRMCEEVLAKLPGQAGRCGEKDFVGVVGEIVKFSFKLFFNASPPIANPSPPPNPTFSLLLTGQYTQEPVMITEFIDVLPPHLKELNYWALICGMVKGGLDNVGFQTQVWMEKDSLKGDDYTDMRIKLLKVMEEAVPAGED